MDLSNNSYKLNKTKKYNNNFLLLKSFKNKISIFLLLTSILTISCTSNIRESDEGEFERQGSDISTDEMIVGDDINFWGVDTPRGVVFIPHNKMSFIKAIGIKPIRFLENNKTSEELAKQIETNFLYRIEVYELEFPTKWMEEKGVLSSNPILSWHQSPDLCEYISENYYKARLLFSLPEASFRVKERNWAPIYTKINTNALTFIRLAVADRFGTIENRASDAIFINAKRTEKQWSEFITAEKRKINSWTCQEFDFLESKKLEAVFYNPDIVINYL